MRTTPQDAVKSMNDTTKGIVMTLRACTEKFGRKLQEEIAELLSLEMLFNKGTAPYPVLWVELKKFLTDRQVQIRVHPCHRASWTIANMIYVDEEVNKIALELTKRIVSGSIYQEGTNVAATTSTQGDPSNYFFAKDQDYKKKTAQNISMRLKDSE